MFLLEGKKRRGGGGKVFIHIDAEHFGCWEVFLRNQLFGQVFDHSFKWAHLCEQTQDQWGSFARGPGPPSTQI